MSVERLPSSLIREPLPGRQGRRSLNTISLCVVAISGWVTLCHRAGRVHVQDWMRAVFSFWPATSCSSLSTAGAISKALAERLHRYLCADALELSFEIVDPPPVISEELEIVGLLLPQRQPGQ